MKKDSIRELPSNVEEIYSHAPEIIERETYDNGFSRGWGMHFPASEEYWLDVHVHYWVKPEDILVLTQNYMERVSELNVKKVVMIPPIPNLGTHGETCSKEYYDARELNPHLIYNCENKDVSWMIYLAPATPDPEFVDEACKKGACGVKLHNAPFIRDGSDRRVWFSREWDETFKVIEKCGIPVLHHPTQRLSGTPYKGGGLHSYWKDGWKNGVNYTNEDLLQDFLELLVKYPNLNFIGAHELFLGWERLVELFDRYKNLFIDTSGACLLREDDCMCEADIKYIRNIFIKYSDRILFGTDVVNTQAEPAKNIERINKSYMRFIKQLRLPYEELQNVTHRNAERLCRI